MLIQTRFYLFQYFIINVNPDTILSVSIPNIVSYIFQESDSGRFFFCKPRNNYSHTVIKQSLIPTKCILGSILQVNLINVITSCMTLYTSEVNAGLT